VPTAKPLIIVALTVIVPADEKLITPPSTEAVPLTTLQLMSLLVALLGVTVPVKGSGVPTTPVFGTPVIFVTGRITVISKSLI
jgi:hypothetical protein